MSVREPRGPSITPEVEREICAAYYETLSVRMTAIKLRLDMDLVGVVVEARYGRKGERFRQGTELARRRAQKQREASRGEMSPRVAAASLHRESPDDLCRRYLGDRFEKRHGSYWLDGRHCPDINERMRAVSRERRARGEPQLPVPEWRV